jgi:hypothetical protein
MCFPPTQEKVERLLERIHLFKIERINFREERRARRAALDVRIARQRKAMQRDLAFEATPERQASRRMWEAIVKPRPIRRKHRARTAAQERRERIAEENRLRYPGDPFMWKS